MRLLKITCYALILFPFLFYKTVFASDEFNVANKVTFIARETPLMNVVQEISLTNNFTNIYATQYSITIDGVKPLNIKAYDSKGPLEVSTDENGNTSTINLKFNQQVVGKGNVLNFTLNYDSTDLIKKTGQVWEITIPKLAKPENIDSYDLILKVPLSFGKAAFMSPFPISQSINESYQVFVFKKDQFSKSGIVSAFGDFQIFDFSLKYHLSNPLEEKIITKIAFPPDTSYQKIIYSNISPEPKNINIDDDGNWIGVYELDPKQDITVNAEGQAKIFSNPVKIVPSDTENHWNDLIKSKEYWEVDDPEIQTLAKQLKTPEKIFKYVVNTLSYDYSRVKVGAVRLGAKKTLISPNNAICTEYTDLLIALLRSAGIPARELTGYAYTDNTTLKPLSESQDVLHAWVEYWNQDKKVWIQVDPTWQDTTGGVDYFNKFDLDHFTFVIRGQNSNQPIPAGGYKNLNNPQKDVQISYGVLREAPYPSSLETTIVLPIKFLSEENASGYIKIKNKGGEALYNLPLVFQSEKLKILSLFPSSIEAIPPYGTIEIPIKVATVNTLWTGKTKITVVVNGQSTELGMEIKSLILNIILPILICFTLILLLILFLRKMAIKILVSNPNV